MSFDREKREKRNTGRTVLQYMDSIKKIGMV
jgi:hypothetical protein